MSTIQSCLCRGFRPSIIKTFGIGRKEGTPASIVGAKHIGFHDADASLFLKDLIASPEISCVSSTMYVDGQNRNATKRSLRFRGTNLPVRPWFRTTVLTELLLQGRHITIEERQLLHFQSVCSATSALLVLCYSEQKGVCTK